MSTTPARTDAQRAVITGYGAITPIGNSAGEYWESLIAGRSGAGPITHFDASPNDVRIAAEGTPEELLAQDHIQRAYLGRE